MHRSFTQNSSTEQWKLNHNSKWSKCRTKNPIALSLILYFMRFRFSTQPQNKNPFFNRSCECVFYLNMHSMRTRLWLLFFFLSCSFDYHSNRLYFLLLFLFAFYFAILLSLIFKQNSCKLFATIANECKTMAKTTRGMKCNAKKNKRTTSCFKQISVTWHRCIYNI